MAEQLGELTRTHTCGALRPDDVGAEVVLLGWVHRVRDHGGLLFIDLRDHYGMTQLVIDPDSGAFKLAETVRSEWVIRVDGEVKKRTPETINAKQATGCMVFHTSSCVTKLISRSSW